MHSCAGRKFLKILRGQELKKLNSSGVSEPWSRVWLRGVVWSMLAWALVCNRRHRQWSGDKAKCPEQGKGEDQRSSIPSTKARVPNGQKLSGKKKRKQNLTPQRQTMRNRPYVQQDETGKKKPQNTFLAWSLSLPKFGIWIQRTVGP